MMTFYIIVAAVLLFVVGPLVYVWFIAVSQFKLLLERTSPDKWTRHCSFPEDKEYADMYEKAEAWGQANNYAMKDVDIFSHGFHLYGQYFDFGFNRAVIIVAGRTEGCRYSCYFAEPYKAAGYNVLVIDNRAHGLSDGHYNCLGFKEYVDIINWGIYLHKLGNESIVCHGICIGSATCLYALLSPECPDYMKGMTADGMYTTFGESFKEHLIQDKHPIFPFMQFFFILVRSRCGVQANKYGPVDRIGEMKKAILFLHSKEDKFSLPEKTFKMYEKCPSENKNFVLCEKGRHSYVRYNNTQRYDETIADFWK